MPMRSVDGVSSSVIGGYCQLPVAKLSAAERPGCAYWQLATLKRRLLLHFRLFLRRAAAFVGGAADATEELVALFRLEVVLEEALGLVERRLVLEHAFLAEVIDDLVVDRDGGRFEAEEHDVGLDERVHVREVAEELTGVALADRLEAVEAERVLLLEDPVE